MSFALTDQILFAQIRVPALQDERQESQLIVFAKGRHTVDFTSRFSIDNRADSPRIRKLDEFDNKKITAEEGSDRILPGVSSSFCRDAGCFARRGKHSADSMSKTQRTR